MPATINAQPKMGQLDMHNSWEPDMSALTGITVHRTLPEGQELGASFVLDSEVLYVTQAEFDRVKNMPSAEEVRSMIAKFQNLVSRGAQ